MNDDRLLDERTLADAFRSVREGYDGTNAESNLTLQRALFRTRTRERKQRFARWIVLPAAAVLFAGAAWAGVTGRLAPAVRSVVDSLHEERSAPSSTPPSPVLATKESEDVVEPAPAAVTVTDPAPPVPQATVEAPAEPPALRREPAPVAVVRPPAEARAPASPPRGVVAPASSALPTGGSAGAAPGPSPGVAVAPSASAPDPHAALFAEAHRLHFSERDPARALAAWDRYLDAAPSGRFAPEARYNRALALVRLGRLVEAQDELSAFATGAYGNYRREETKALLDALARDASRP